MRGGGASAAASTSNADTDDKDAIIAKLRADAAKIQPNMERLRNATAKFYGESVDGISEQAALGDAVTILLEMKEVYQALELDTGDMGLSSHHLRAKLQCMINTYKGFQSVRPILSQLMKENQEKLNQKDREQLEILMRDSYRFF